MKNLLFCTYSVLGVIKKPSHFCKGLIIKYRGLDSNQRPSGYEPKDSILSNHFTYLLRYKFVKSCSKSYFDFRLICFTNIDVFYWLQRYLICNTPKQSQISILNIVKKKITKCCTYVVPKIKKLRHKSQLSPLYLEPGSNRHSRKNWILNPARLPIPPSRLSKLDCKFIIFFYQNLKKNTKLFNNCIINFKFAHYKQQHN